MSISASNPPRMLLLRPTTAAPLPSCSMIMDYSVPALLSYTPPISATATSRPWARNQASACFCPTTERDLADGIGPARRLADAGSALTLGSDQHAVIDPFEELRGLEMHERLATGERGRFTPGELIMIASAAGYRSLGWPERRPDRRRRACGLRRRAI